MAFADAQIAQLVEQRTENPRVTGSIPVLGTFSKDNRRIIMKRTESPSFSVFVAFCNAFPL